MNSAGGFLIIINEPKRAEKISSLISEGIFEGHPEFTDILSAADWRPKETEICLLSFDGKTFVYAALAKRGKRVATAKYRVRFSNFINLYCILFNDIEREIGPRFKKHFIRSTSGIGGRVPPVTWDSLLECIKKLRKGIAPELQNLQDLCSTQARSFYGHGYEIVSQERDAVGLSLSIFGPNRRELLQQNIPTPQNKDLPPAPFLKNLSKAVLLEDPTIGHDMHVFGDWNLVKDFVTGSVEFRHGNQQLTIVNANRTKIEETLGVDLLYYHHKYNSFVMVQYKRMDCDNGFVKGYYPNSDGSYKKEMSRMNDFESTYSNNNEVLAVDDYRLHEGAFYFKLCPKITYKPLLTDLIKGMYFPLDYWKYLVSSPEVKGHRGGLLVNSKNASRWFSNTLFVDLVKAGWVGSRSDVSSVISNIVQELLESNHSVTIAASKENVPVIAIL